MAKASTVPVKRIGGNRAKRETVPFELVAYREDEEVVLSFLARPSGETAELLQIIRAAGNDKNGELAQSLMRMLSKQISDKDGVPNAWRPEEVPPPKIKDANGDEGEPATPSKKPEPQYRGPDGELYEMRDGDQLKKFEALEAGSSRRRWRFLMLEDEELEVYLEDLMGLAEWMIEQGGKDRTQPAR